MIVELPVLIDLPTFGGQKYEESRIMVNIDSIQSLAKMSDQKKCLLSLTNGETHQIPMPYDEVKSLWFRFILMKDQCDFVTYDKDAVSEKDNPMFKFIDENSICPGCAGINIAPSDDGKDMVCQDCGVVKEKTDKV